MIKNWNMRTKSDLLSLLRSKDRYLNKQMRFFFSNLYGIGTRRVLFLLIYIGLNKNYSLKLHLFRRDVKYRYMERMLVRKDILYGRILRKRRNLISTILRNVFCYRGMRRIYGKPSRGQRTHSNASTASKFALKMLVKKSVKFAKSGRRKGVLSKISLNSVKKSSKKR